MHAGWVSTQQSYPVALDVETGISPDSFHGGSVEWREVHRALYTLLRGSTQDSLYFLRKTFVGSWQEYALRPVGMIEWLAEQHATLYPDEPHIRYRLRGTDTYVTDEQAARIRRIRLESRQSAAFQAATEEAVICGNGVPWCRPVVRDGKFVGVRWSAKPAHTQGVDVAETPESSDELDVTSWWVVLPVKGTYEARLGMPRYGIARFDRNGGVWEYAPDKSLIGKSVWPRPGTGKWIDDIPAVVIRRMPAADGEFWARTRDTLLAQNRAVDLGETDAGDVVHMQGHGQWVGEGMTPEQAGVVHMGPKRIATIPQGAKLDAKQASPDLEGIRDVADGFLSKILATNTVNADALFKDGSITALAKEVGLWDRTEKRKVMVATCRAAEQRAYDITRKMFAAFGDATLPDCEIEVEYAHREAPRDPLHLMQESGWRVAMGWETPASELLRREKNAKPLADYEKRISENRQKTIAQIGYMPSPPGLGPGAGTPALPADSADAASAKPSTPMPVDSKTPQAEAPGVLATKPTAVVTDVQKTALNGAQVTALLEVVQSVASGKLPPAAGRETILASFDIDPAAVDRMLGALKGFVPAADKPSEATAPDAPPRPDPAPEPPP